jgi:hypothetical protein
MPCRGTSCSSSVLRHRCRLRRIAMCRIRGCIRIRVEGACRGVIRICLRCVRLICRRLGGEWNTLLITWFTSERRTQHQRCDCRTTQRNTTTNHCTVPNRIILFRSSTTIYILYFYLVGVGIMPNLAASAAAPLCAHPLRRRLTVLTTTTLLYSN